MALGVSEATLIAVLLEAVLFGSSLSLPTARTLPQRDFRWIYRLLRDVSVHHLAKGGKSTQPNYSGRGHRNVCSCAVRECLASL